MTPVDRPAQQPAEQPAEQAAGHAEPIKPSLRDRLRPLELLGLAAVFGGFMGLVTFVVLQEWKVDWFERWPLWPIVFGVGFIVSLVVLAMLALVGYQPPPAPGQQGVLGEQDERAARDGH